MDLRSRPCCHFWQKPWQRQLCLLQMLQEDSEDEAWTRMRIRDKSAALGGTLLGSASSIKYWCFGFTKSLSTSRKKICCYARTVSLRSSEWQKHCARDSCVHPRAKWYRLYLIAPPIFQGKAQTTAIWKLIAAYWQCSTSNPFDLDRLIIRATPTGAGASAEKVTACMRYCYNAVREWQLYADPQHVQALMGWTWLHSSI